MKTLVCFPYQGFSLLLTCGKHHLGQLGPDVLVVQATYNIYIKENGDKRKKNCKKI